MSIVIDNDDKNNQQTNERLNNDRIWTVVFKEVIDSMHLHLPALKCQSIIIQPTKIKKKRKNPTNK